MLIKYAIKMQDKVISTCNTSCLLKKCLERSLKGCYVLSMHMSFYIEKVNVDLKFLNHL